MLGVAGTVGVFVAMLAMAQGFQATLVASGSPRNAVVRRAGADSEIVSSISLEELRVIDLDAPGVGRDAGGPLASGEVVVIWRLLPPLGSRKLVYGEWGCAP